MSEAAKALWKVRPVPKLSDEAREKIRRGCRKALANRRARAPIPKCHPDRKHCANGMCKACYDADYARVNKRRVRKNQRAWTVSHRPATRCYHRKKKYGVTREQFEARLESQHHLCAICGEFMASPHQDHDHKTNTARGLLCGNCNRGLGCFRENPQRMIMAVYYLTLWDEKKETL